MSETNHQLFLEETLWEFSRCGILTDLVFVCSDQEKVAAHKAILSQYSCGALLFSLSPSTSFSSHETSGDSLGDMSVLTEQSSS